MHFLQLELERNEALAAVVNALSMRTAEYSTKMGLILDLNPFWLEASRIAYAGLDPDRVLSRFLHYPYQPWSPFPLRLLELFSGEKLPELGRRFEYVEEANEFFFNRPTKKDFQPFLLRIIAHPNPDKDDRDELVAIAREAPIPTVVETHGIPQLIVAPGSQVVSPLGQRGTLGGYLRDLTSNAVFAVTCGHVISCSAKKQVVPTIGTVTHCAEPIPLPTSKACYASCGFVTDLDIALIDTNVNPSNQASSIVNLVGNGQIVEMKGATSGTRTYEIGGAVVDYEIGGACWHKLIQLHAPLSNILHPAVQVARTSSPKQGDSGAWIIRNHTEWAGMVVATSSLFGFALSASDMINQANGVLG